MTVPLAVRRCVALAFLGFCLPCFPTFSIAALSQVPASCGAAPVADEQAQPNIFTEQGEQWLGEAMADAVEGEMRPVRDPSLSRHLQDIADRLVAVLPPTKIQYHVMLIESSEVNGYSIAGGHIYLTRKLVSVARSDDELAGVIGHEIGHIASHQFAFETTHDLKRLLGVTSVGDRADIYTKFQKLMDAELRDQHAGRKDEDSKQDEADRIGVYATAAAGYQPSALPEFWDRAFFVGGKTRGKVADFFGITKPSEKRLRSMRALAASMPTGCGGTLQADAHAFAVWHDAVIANQQSTAARVSGSAKQLALQPSLRMELDQIRFSPDGKSLLAQDESSILVMSRDPFALRYRIDAPQATAANFSPDSESITFSTPGLHTEQWSATENKLLAAHELLPRQDCYESKLAPDGRSLLCVSMNLDTLALSLSLMDTTTSQVVWEKKPWSSANWGAAIHLLVARMNGADDDVLFSAYTPDNKVLLLGSGIDKLALDLDSRSPVKIGGDLPSLQGTYAFLGTDKLAAINPSDTKRSGVYSFPQGKKLQGMLLPPLTMRSVTNPGSAMHLVMFGAKDFETGLGDLNTAKFVAALKTHSLDEFDGTLAIETAAGGVAVLPANDLHSKSRQVLDLPLSPLASLRAVSASPSGRYLAASTRSRGAIWDTATGQQLFLLHGFTDASWTKDDTVYLDMPKQFASERHIFEVSLTDHAVKMEPYQADDETHMRYGRLTAWVQDPKKKTWTLSLHSPADNAVLWKREFADAHLGYTASYGDRDLLFSFGLKTNTAKEALKANPGLNEQVSRIKNKDRGRLLQVVDGRTGEIAGNMALELPPNFAGIDGVNRAGDLIYVAGNDDRTAVYSMSTGKELRKIFGEVMAMDPETGRICTANRMGEAVVYGADGDEIAHLHEGEPIRYAVFRQNGKVLTFLTAGQEMRTLEVPDRAVSVAQSGAAGVK